MRFYIPLVLLLIMVCTSFPSSFGYSEYLDQVILNHEKSKWSIGEGLSPGDMYSYRICGDSTIPPTVIESHCYQVELEFLQTVELSNGEYWMVQTLFVIDDIPEYTIIYINSDTFKVIPVESRFIDFTKSLENTIFSLSQYGEKRLLIGEKWDDIPSYFTQDIPLMVNEKRNVLLSFGSVDTFVLSYDIIISSETFISEDFPFPILSIIYSPYVISPNSQLEYSFELLDYSIIDIENNLELTTMCIDNNVVDERNEYNLPHVDYPINVFDGTIDVSTDDIVGED